MGDVCLDFRCEQNRMRAEILPCECGPTGCRRLRTRASVAVLEPLFREPVLAQQAAELVVAQAQDLGRDGLLELRALERAPQHLALEVCDGRAKVRGHA